MSNTELTRLMEMSAIHPEDRPEVERIFACLTEERRLAILSDWPRMAERIKRNREVIEEQKRLLLTNAVSGLIDNLSSFNREIVSRDVKREITGLKRENVGTSN